MGLVLGLGSGFGKGFRLELELGHRRLEVGGEHGVGGARIGDLFRW